MGVNQAKTLEFAWNGHIPGCHRDDNLLGVSDNDINDFSISVDEQADLASYFMGQFNQKACKPRVRDIFSRCGIGIEGFNLFDLGVSQAGGVAVQFFLH